MVNGLNYAVSAGLTIAALSCLTGPCRPLTRQGPYFARTSRRANIGPAILRAGEMWPRSIMAVSCGSPASTTAIACSRVKWLRKPAALAAMSRDSPLGKAASLCAFSPDGLPRRSFSLSRRSRSSASSTFSLGLSASRCSFSSHWLSSGRAAAPRRHRAGRGHLGGVDTRRLAA